MGGKHKELVHISQDELTNLEKDTPKCKYCNKSIWYDSTKVSFRNDGQLGFEIGGTTYRTTKTLNGRVYPILVCQHCLEKKYPDFKEKNKSKIFNTFNKYVVYAFEIPQDIIDEKNKLSVPTLENCIRKHGEVKGREVFEEYKRKQAYTNSFEYKKEKYGWSKEQYDEYNKSRAVTYENLIKKHGLDEGERIWKQYCERQSYTSTTQYLKETFSDDKVNEIQLLKSRQLEGFISKYGEKQGKELYNKYLENTNDRKTYSKFSKDFFDELSEELKKSKIDVRMCYGDNEHWRYSNSKKIYFFDFYIPEIRYVIEFNGDYWHCNPQKYDESYEHTLRHMSAKEIWKIDEERYNVIKNELGYNLTIIWEHDVRYNRKQIILNLIKDIKKYYYVSKNKENRENQ